MSVQFSNLLPPIQTKDSQAREHIQRVVTNSPKLLEIIQKAASTAMNDVLAQKFFKQYNTLEGQIRDLTANQLNESDREWLSQEVESMVSYLEEIRTECTQKLENTKTAKSQLDREVARIENQFERPALADSKAVSVKRTAPLERNDLIALSSTLSNLQTKKGELEALAQEAEVLFAKLNDWKTAVGENQPFEGAPTLEQFNQLLERVKELPTEELILPEGLLAKVAYCSKVAGRALQDIATIGAELNSQLTAAKAALLEQFESYQSDALLCQEWRAAGNLPEPGTFIERLAPHPRMRAPLETVKWLLSQPAALLRRLEESFTPEQNALKELAETSASPNEFLQKVSSLIEKKEGEIQTCTSRISQVEEEKAGLQDQIATLETQIEEFASQAEVIARLEETKAKLEAELMASRTKLEELANDKQRLEGECEALRAEAEKGKRLESEMDELSAQLRAEQSGKSKALEQELQKLKTQLTSKKRDLDQAQAAVTDLSAKQTSLEQNAQTEGAELQKRIRELSAELETKEEQVTLWEEEKAALEQDLCSIQAQLVSKEKDLMQTQATVTTLSAEKAALEQNTQTEGAELQERICKLSAELELKEKQVGALTGKKAAHVQELQTLKTQLASKERDLNQAQATVTTLSAEKAALEQNAQTKGAELQERIRELSAELEAKERQVESLNGEKAALDRSVDGLTAQVRDKEAKLQEHAEREQQQQECLEALAGEKAALEGRIQELTEELEVRPNAQVACVEELVRIKTDFEKQIVDLRIELGKIPYWRRSNRRKVIQEQIVELQENSTQLEPVICQLYEEIQPQSVDQFFQDGLNYANGEGVARDLEKATELWRKAASCGHEESKEILLIHRIFQPDSLKEFTEDHKGLSICFGSGTDLRLQFSTSLANALKILPGYNHYLRVLVKINSAKNQDFRRSLSEALKTTQSISDFTFLWQGHDDIKEDLPDLIEALKENKSISGVALLYQSVFDFYASQRGESPTTPFQGNIGEENIHAIAELLKHNETLDRFQINIGNDDLQCIEVLAESLKHNRTLVSFDLGKYFKVEGSNLHNLFVKALKENPTLISLSLNGVEKEPLLKEKLRRNQQEQDFALKQAQEGSDDVLNLLSQSVSPYVGFRQNLLHIAAENNQPHLLRHLLGSLPNKMFAFRKESLFGGGGRTALEIAEEKGHDEVAGILRGWEQQVAR